MSALISAVSNSLKRLVIAKSTPKVKIEEWPFRVQYTYTTSILILFVSILCTRDYFNANIKCVPIHEDENSDPVIERKILETYCYIRSTFTTPYKNDTFNTLDLHTSYTLGGSIHIEGETEKKYHAYYQWVPFFLFFQAILFYAPHALWKKIEGEKVKKIVQGLHVSVLSRDQEKSTEKKLDLMADYLVNSRGTHFSYSFWLVVCEFLHFGCLIGNIYLTDIFLRREFSMYGPRVVQFLEQDPEFREDPMAIVFPRITKCLFHKFGPSGSVERFDGLCILTTNIFNEKMFVFLWFWYVSIGILTGIALMFRIASLMSSRARYSSLDAPVYPVNKQIGVVMHHLGKSSWFLLRLLSLNLDGKTFQTIIQKTHDRISI